VLRAAPALGCAVALGLLASVAGAHTVSLGREVVKGACAVLQEQSESRYFIYRQQTNRVRYVDGTVETSALILPSRPLPGQQADDLMTECARQTGTAMRERRPGSSTAGPERAPEEDFKLRLNQCLQAHRAPYEASFVVLRRGDVVCPASAQ
jgi:hypothetical protein